MIIKKGGLMDDKKISKYIHYAERSLLVFIAFATVFATVQEIIVLVDNERVLLEDLLLLFIYTEVLGMVAAFYRSNRIPVTLPPVSYTHLTLPTTTSV